MYKKKCLRKYFEVFAANREDCKTRKKYHDSYAQDFYNQGLLRKATKGWRLFAHGKVGKETQHMKERVKLVMGNELERR